MSIEGMMNYTNPLMQLKEK